MIIFAAGLYVKVPSNTSTLLPPRNIYTECLGESYYAPYFFSFFVSGHPASVNDVQGIRLHKLPKMKLLRATKMWRGLHIRGIILAPNEGY